ncbi:MAG: thiamine-phosphate kinase [Gammaproteobacteria bacterium]|nr:thiamine-phosphate kinase [Gammaproteobacteria bacterium]
MSEQAIIARYFSRHSAGGSVEVGIGDDGAVVRPPENSRLVITSDTLNEGIHFESGCLPEHLGHKALAVSLSDLAAMGAAPLWATLNLSLLETEHDWLEGFSRGLFALADRYGVRIVGGDLARGPLSISVQAIGYLESGSMLTRSNAMPGDLICVSGTIGDAALGLRLRSCAQGHDISGADQEYFALRLDRPEPRVDIGLGIRVCASAAIDVSDGLLRDVQQVASMSKVGACINIEQIPLSEAMQKQLKTDKDWNVVLSGGEDYELVFTVHPEHRATIHEISEKTGCPISLIGQITRGSGIELLRAGRGFPMPGQLGFDHFV